MAASHDRLTRPPTPAGFDSSRAAERAAEPHGWRFGAAELEAVYRVISERRDIRRFRPDPVPDRTLERVLGAAHKAPSVGLMQPWRFLIVRDLQTRIAVRSLAQRERLRQADRFDERARHFLDQKIEGVVEAPLGVCVCCDHGDPGIEVLGRGTIPETDVYSTACAIQNLWLAARAEGLGVGWVSFYRPDDMRALLGIPDRADPIAYLCLGWPDERPVRPGLEAAGWSSRLPLAAVVMRERWESGEQISPRAAGGSASEQAAAEQAIPERIDPAQVSGRADRRAEAMIAARDRSDQLVKPAGSLGALETLIERWALVAGEPPPAHVRAGVLVCAADHGHTRHGTSLFGAEVSAQVAAAAARWETAVGVLARQGGHELLVADVGLAGPTPAGVRNVKVAPGSADMLERTALTERQLDAALEIGAQLCADLAGRGVDCVVLGEIGIGNTATSAALVCALTGASPELAVGRGTGLDTGGIERKRAVVNTALRNRGLSAGCRDMTDPFNRHEEEGPAGGADAREALLAVGGLELAALTGAMREAARLGLPAILDGYAVGAAALAAVRLQPSVAEALFASHRSAEPGHALVLTELGLEPLLDLRLRLGEASGALLALPLIAAAGALHREMGTFEESGVERAS